MSNFQSASADNKYIAEGYHPPSETHWQEVLNFRDIPILVETRDALRPKLKDPQVNFETLAPLIEQDPALCWHLLQETATRNPDSKEQLTNARSCISLLGMKAFVALVKKLRVVQRDPKSYSEQVYRQAIYTSHMAGCLAAQWAVARRSGSPNCVKWTAMLAHSVLWPWLLTHEASHNWLHRLSEGDDILTASNRVFGIDTDHWHILARRHNLPDHLVKIFTQKAPVTLGDWQFLRRTDPRDASSKRSLIHQCKSDSMLALTAGSSAWHMHIAPEGRKSKRWLKLASHIQGLPQIKMLVENRKVQIQEARLRNDGIASGIALLASPEPTKVNYQAYVPEQIHQEQQEDLRQETSKDTPAAIAPVSKGTNEHSEDNAKNDNDYLLKLISQLKDEPNSFGDWNYLIQGVLKGITEGIGIKHACILLPNKQRTHLRAVYCENTTGIEHLIKAHYELNSIPLFKQLMKQTLAIRIKPGNHTAYLRGIPDDLLSQIPENSLFMSINAGSAPIGIVLATSGVNKQITAQQYHSFKHLCNVTSKGLYSLKVMRQRRQAS